MSDPLQVLAAIVRLVPGHGYLADLSESMVNAGVADAVARHDTGHLFEWLAETLSYQGISNAAAASFIETHGRVGWPDMVRSFAVTPACPKLGSFAAFRNCGYRLTRGSCNEPALYPACPLPALPLRRGSLNQMAFSLYLFIRDVCGGDLVAWLDDRLASASDALPAIGRCPSQSGHTASSAFKTGEDGAKLAAAVSEPLCGVYGLSQKVVSLALSALLLGADPNRVLWVEAGAAMIVVDTLVHNLLHRTGVLRAHGAEHPYGPACYRPGACVDILRDLAAGIDAQAINPDYPGNFPRLVQLALWRFRATGELNICNGVNIGDRHACRQTSCPVFTICDHVPLRGRAS